MWRDSFLRGSRSESPVGLSQTGSTAPAVFARPRPGAELRVFASFVTRRPTKELRANHSLSQQIVFSG